MQLKPSLSLSLSLSLSHSLSLFLLLNTSKFGNVRSLKPICLPFLSLSLSCTNTHTRAHAHTHTQISPLRSALLKSMCLNIFDALSLSLFLSVRIFSLQDAPTATNFHQTMSQKWSDPALKRMVYKHIILHSAETSTGFGRYFLPTEFLCASGSHPFGSQVPLPSHKTILFPPWATKVTVWQVILQFAFNWNWAC